MDRYRATLSLSERIFRIKLAAVCTEPENTLALETEQITCPRQFTFLGAVAYAIPMLLGFIGDGGCLANGSKWSI